MKPHDSTARPRNDVSRFRSWMLAACCVLGIWYLAGVPSLAAPRPAWTGNRVGGSPLPPAPYAVQRWRPQINFDHPVDLAFSPDGARLFVAEQGGRLWSLDAGRPDASPELAIDLRRHRRPFDSVLGFTFHPGFATNRFVFINYNEPGGRENGSCVSRFTLSSLVPPVIDPASERVLLRWFSGGHGGCTLAFGNDGFLYVSTGDAADPDPPDGKRNTGQDIGDLLASILRIDVDRTEGTKTYAIPRDNPFVSTPGARPEVWAFGFRNPFRFSFDKATGELWAGDVGWELWEMVYRVERGGNYGWPITEGPNLNVRNDVKPGPGPILPPVHSVPHSDGASVTGGFVYRGKKLPKLQGAYIYGDWETGKFWALRHEAGKLVSNDELCDTSLKPVAFALDSNGELLVLDYNGGLYEFIPNNAPPANQSFPRKLSDTGLFASLIPPSPAPGTVLYQIAAPMWNDHAKAEWLLAVPGSESIRTKGGVGNITGETWFFPSNTVLTRTLALEMEAGNAISARRIETQLLHWDGQAWNPYSYRWRKDGTEADLVGVSGTNDVFKVKDPLAPGGERETSWRFMSRAECLRCHNAWAGDALTLNWLQLGFRRDKQEGARTELQRLEALGILRAENAPRNLEPLANPYDEAHPLADRARSWLHVNCSACHRFGAGGAVAIHLNFDKSPRDWRALDEKPTRGDFGLVGARIITPGSPYRSSLFYRISTEGAGHMPQIGARLVDETGTRLVFDWIRSLEGKPGPMDTNAADRSLLELNSRLQGQFARLAHETGASQTQLVRDILGSMNGALGLLDVVSQMNAGATDVGNQAASANFAFRSMVVDVASSHTNAMVRDLFQRLLPSSMRRRTLGADIQPSTILSLTGAAARGRALFTGASQCASCHVCAGEGRAFGPDLTGIGRKFNRAQLIDHIVSPSKTIAPEFKTVTLTLRDDSEVNGFVLRRDNGEWLLRDAAMAERRIPAAQIKESRESTLSAMPDGLLAPLTAQEASDLVEFLFTSGKPE